ncbi:MAG: endonuclease Q family protein [Candidatus Aenigmatarchaeota archaeon]
MQVIADLHIHSKYSRAVSKDMDLDGLARGSITKGISVLGTGDFLHPIWNKELKSKLTECGESVYEYGGIKFILSGEVSLIYRQDGKARRVHHIMLCPGFDVLEQVKEYFAKKGRMDYDGRPIFGFSSIELVDSLMNISKDIEIIPAHAWTPWFSLFGSMSGFNSIAECFQDKAKYIHSIETGLSSDPAMNWRLSQLDNITFVSNSDSHSPHPYRLGREANVFEMKEVSYANIISSIRTRKGFMFTVEVDPSYGKYHYDGHRQCEFSCEPKESIRLSNRCPKCKSKLTIGVLHRVEELADREEGFIPPGSVPYKSMLPLSELIANATGTGVFSKKTISLFGMFIEAFGNEFNILLNASRDDLAKIDENVADIIIKCREGNLKVIPGFDGEYGRIEGSKQKIHKKIDKEASGQKSLGAFS